MRFWLGLACGVLLGGVVGMLTMARAIPGDSVVVCPPPGVTPEHPWSCHTVPLLDPRLPPTIPMDMQGAVYAGRDKDGVHHVILTDEQGRVIMSPESEHTSGREEFEEPRPTQGRNLIPTGPDVRVWRPRCRSEQVWELEQP